MRKRFAIVALVGTFLAGAIATAALAAAPVNVSQPTISGTLERIQIHIRVATP